MATPPERVAAPGARTPNVVTGIAAWPAGGSAASESRRRDLTQRHAGPILPTFAVDDVYPGSDEFGERKGWNRVTLLYVGQIKWC